MELTLLWELMQAVDGPIFIALFFLWRIIKGIHDRTKSTHDKINEWSSTIQHKDYESQIQNISRNINDISTDIKDVYRFTHPLKSDSFHDKFKEVHLEILAIKSSISRFREILCAYDNDGRPKIWFPSQIEGLLENLNDMIASLLNELKKR